MQDLWEVKDGDIQPAGNRLLDLGRNKGSVERNYLLLKGE